MDFARLASEAGHGPVIEHHHAEKCRMPMVAPMRRKSCDVHGPVRPPARTSVLSCTRFFIGGRGAILIAPELALAVPDLYGEGLHVDMRLTIPRRKAPRGIACHRVQLIELFQRERG
jgi:hypothetical protein